MTKEGTLRIPPDLFLIFFSFDLIADLNSTVLDKKSSAPGFSNEKIRAGFGDAVSFYTKPVPLQESRMEKRSITRFP